VDDPKKRHCSASLHCVPRSSGVIAKQVLELFRSELILTESQVVVRRTAVAEIGGKVVGFATIEGSGSTSELGMLFVVPEAMGKGPVRWALSVRISGRAYRLAPIFRPPSAYFSYTCATTWLCRATGIRGWWLGSALYTRWSATAVTKQCSPGPKAVVEALLTAAEG
jgi:hypothetical protein